MKGYKYIYLFVLVIFMVSIVNGSTNTSELNKGKIINNKSEIKNISYNYKQTNYYLNGVNIEEVKRIKLNNKNKSVNNKTKIEIKKPLVKNITPIIIKKEVGFLDNIFNMIFGVS